MHTARGVQSLVKAGVIEEGLSRGSHCRILVSAFPELGRGTGTVCYGRAMYSVVIAENQFVLRLLLVLGFCLCLGLPEAHVHNAWEGEHRRP